MNGTEWPEGKIMKLLDLKRVAEVLSCSERTVRRLILMGQLKALTLGTGRRRQAWRVEEIDLADFIERRRLSRGKVHQPQPREMEAVVWPSAFPQ